MAIKRKPKNLKNGLRPRGEPAKAEKCNPNLVIQKERKKKRSRARVPPRKKLGRKAGKTVPNKKKDRHRGTRLESGEEITGTKKKVPRAPAKNQKKSAGRVLDGTNKTKRRRKTKRGRRKERIVTSLFRPSYAKTFKTKEQNQGSGRLGEARRDGSKKTGETTEGLRLGGLPLMLEMTRPVKVHVGEFQQEQGGGGCRRGRNGQFIGSRPVAAGKGGGRGGCRNPRL